MEQCCYGLGTVVAGAIGNARSHSALKAGPAKVLLIAVPDPVTPESASRPARGRISEGDSFG